jgi:hypothetical protein
MKNGPPAKKEPAGFNTRFSRGLSRALRWLKIQDVPHIKRIVVTVLGGSVLIFGVALIFLPGQVVVILAGLAILGTEYAWARHLLRKGRQLASRALSQTQRLVTSKPGHDAAEKPFPPGQPEPASVVSASPAEIADSQVP